MMNYKKAVKSYLESCKMNDYSPVTIENKSSHLAWFGDFLNGREVTPSAVLEWKQGLSDRGVKITTLNAYMEDVKNFYDWAVSMELIERNPFLANGIMPPLRKLAQERSKPYDTSKLLSEQECLWVLHRETCPGEHGQKEWARNKAIVVTFVTTALRNSELCALRPCDLDFENGLITIEHGKGDKFAVIGFPVPAQEAIKMYLDSGFRGKASDTDPLFGSYGKGRGGKFHGFSRQVMSAIVEKITYQITGHKDVRSHALRHTSATTMYNKGVPIDVISEKLRHANVVTTKRYAGKMNESVLKQYDVFESMAKRA